jgi:hypothetical protein
MSRDEVTVRRAKARSLNLNKNLTRARLRLGHVLDFSLIHILQY